MTAGLAAYFIRMAQLGQLNDDDGSPVDRSPLGIKQFIVKKAWSRYGKPRHGIFNAIDPEQQFCLWNPDSVTRRLRRADDNPQCLIPASTSGPNPTTIPVPVQTQSLSCHNNWQLDQQLHRRLSLELYLSQL